MVSDSSQNNKRIAKNTLLLYFRMLLTMAVSLYTSRVVLGALGVEDYGIYNVVGGVVAMFSILSGSLSSAISRYLAFEIGRNNEKKLSEIFSSSITIQLIISVIIVIVSETIGLWFLNNKMVIPEHRIVAANWVYQISIFTFVVNLLSIPYNACIIAHERMSAFAWISILEALGKLVIAWCIIVSPIDKLVFFSSLIALMALIIRGIYTYYCNRHFHECKYNLKIRKEIFKEMLSFAGWNFIGSSSAILRDQGGSILINLFFGPSVNAARAVANRVNAAITSFVQNFMIALNPQITKSYANGDKDYMFKLIYEGARLSYYILLLLSAPVLLNTHYILVLWLKVVPEYTVIFIQLTLLFALCESISNPLITATQATGKIKKYQIIVGGLQMLNIPIAYFILKHGGSPESILYVAIIISQSCLSARLLLLKNLIGLKICYYLKHVYINVIIVSLLSLIVPYVVSCFIIDSLLCFIVTTLTSIFFTLFVVFYVGCSKLERKNIIIIIKKTVAKIRYDKHC